MFENHRCQFNKQFTSSSFEWNFLHLQFVFEFYLAKGNKQRAAHKMLVKLTASTERSEKYKIWMGFQKKLKLVWRY